MAGHQTYEVCGMNSPYKVKAQKEMENMSKESIHEGKLMGMLHTLLEQGWLVAKEAFPKEWSNMNRIRELAPKACLGQTGFHKVSVGINAPASWHVDDNNLKDSIQVNFIMGEFEGAPLQLDPLRRHKRDDVSKDIIKIPNEHGMMFIGRYDQVWHAVDEVTSGERVLIAAYASQSIGDFVEKISQNGMSFLDATEEGERRAQEKKDDDKKRKAKYRGADAANIP